MSEKKPPRPTRIIAAVSIVRRDGVLRCTVFTEGGTYWIDGERTVRDAMMVLATMLAEEDET